MRIEGSEFGKITIDGRTYEHDVIIRAQTMTLQRRSRSSMPQTISGPQRIVSFGRPCRAAISGYSWERTH